MSIENDGQLSLEVTKKDLDKADFILGVWPQCPFSIDAINLIKKNEPKGTKIVVIDISPTEGNEKNRDFYMKNVAKFDPNRALRPVPRVFKKAKNGKDLVFIGGFDSTQSYYRNKRNLKLLWQPIKSTTL